MNLKCSDILYKAMTSAKLLLTKDDCMCSINNVGRCLSAGRMRGQVAEIRDPQAQGVKVTWAFTFTMSVHPVTGSGFSRRLFISMALPVQL